MNEFSIFEDENLSFFRVYRYSCVKVFLGHFVSRLLASFLLLFLKHLKTLLLQTRKVCTKVLLDLSFAVKICVHQIFGCFWGLNFLLRRQRQNQISTRTLLYMSCNLVLWLLFCFLLCIFWTKICELCAADCLWDVSVKCRQSMLCLNISHWEICCCEILS